MAEQTICTPYWSRTIKGWKIRVRLCFSADPSYITAATIVANADGFTTILNNLTNSTWNTVTQSVQASPYGSSGNYDNAEDAVVMFWQTTDGTVSKQQIPNPKSNIFLADEMTVDATNSAVAAYIAFMNPGGDPTAGWVSSTKSGAYFATFLGGLRKRSRTRRKYNIYVKNPELSAPGI